MIYLGDVVILTLVGKTSDQARSHDHFRALPKVRVGRQRCACDKGITCGHMSKAGKAKRENGISFLTELYPSMIFAIS
jgi:hypothetical protein